MTSPRPTRGRLSDRVAGTYPLAETYHLAFLADEMERVTAEVSSIVPGATGLNLPGTPNTVVIDRSQWIERNVASFAHLTEPARRKIEERMEESGTRSQTAAAMAERVMTVETRAVLSLLSRRVLGQYELVLPTGEQGDVVAYVGPNILHLERAHQFKPAEFRYWVALHELTHRAQFQGIPWMRDYFLSLVEELVESSKPEPGILGRVMDEIGDRRARGRPVVDERGLLGLFGSDEQNAVVDRVQALMSLLEGHGHVVMDRVGAERLRSQERMSRVLKGRRHDKRTAALFRLTGLEMKMNQYAKGEKFVLAVEREAGWDTVRLAFRGASSLPTLDEIESPGRWLERVA
ncbi:MAG TPA: zinc-dependent metalloprotease [Acidimicrobiia bacterium]|nr:zinc-dependent metalloprotease [Acidimicrobiia bacterium]